MKIKEILRVLTTSSQDFSDHAARNDAGNLEPMHVGGRYPNHEPCEFCTAWHQALAVLELNILEFEPHDLVELPGGIPGRVMGVDTTVRVEVQKGEHGPWAVGSFRPEDLRHREAVTAPEFTYWAERGGIGDIWERRENDQMMRVFRLIKIGLKTPQVPWGEQPCSFGDVEKVHGPLTQIDKP